MSGNESCMVNAPVFRKWWGRLCLLADQDRNNKRLGTLLDCLNVIGRRAGAIRGPGPYCAPSYLDEMGFDWDNKEIDFAVEDMPPHLVQRYDPYMLIAELTSVTGISAQL